MDPLDKALFPDFKSLMKLAEHEPDGKRYKALKLSAEGHLDSGAAMFTEYLKEKPSHDLETKLGELRCKLDQEINGFIAGMFGNAYVLRRKRMPKVAIDLFCAGAGFHFEDSAYNAANALLHDSGSPGDIELAEKYFLQAIGDTEDPSKKAAALVNYAEIVRDGRITGKPDYPGAIALYEQAAELGLVTGMFNAGNVSMWMFQQGDSSHAGKGIYWLTRLQEHFASGKPFLEMDQSNLGKGFLESAIDMLVKFHVLSDCPEADVEVGLELLLSRPETHESAKGRRWIIEQAVIKRLKKAINPAQNTPGHNWQHVLSQLGWFCCEPASIDEMQAECFMVESARNGNVLFMVMNGLFDPERPSKYLLRVIDYMRESGVKRFFLAPSSALFRHHEGRIYTPVMVANHSAIGIGFIGLDGGPDATFNSSHLPIDHLEYLSTDSCVISIAINRLNEGFSLQEDLDLGSMFGEFGGWGIPMKNEESPKAINMI